MKTTILKAKYKYGWISPKGKIYCCAWAEHGFYAMDHILGKNNKYLKNVDPEGAVRHLLSKGWVKFYGNPMNDKIPIEFEYKYRDDELPNGILFAMGKIVKGDK